MLLAEKTVQGESNSMLFVIKFDVVSCFFFFSRGVWDGMGGETIKRSIFENSVFGLYTDTFPCPPAPG